MEPQRGSTPSEGSGQGGDLSHQRPKRWILVGLLVGGFFLANVAFDGGDGGEDLGYSEFIASVETGRVERVRIESASGSIDGVFRDGETFSTQGPAGEVPARDLALLGEHGVERNYEPSGSNFFGALLIGLLPFGLLIAFFWWMSRRAQGQMGAMMNIGRSRAKVWTTEKPNTTFADVAGYTGVKEEVNEVVDFLRHAERFAAIGARIPKGVLLVGPPGTGKTLIARAVAGEAAVPFISVTGSDFMEMFVGIGAARVRDLFETARKAAPAIIFVDEIDSVGRKRGAGLGGGHDEREQTLNQMLAEMDGFDTTEGVVMMAATNRPDILDPALLRPGRFDRQVVVPLPTHEERRAILGVHCRDKRMDADIDLDVVARGTPGMSGADLANLVNEAALFAVRRGASRIGGVDFEDARDRVIMGQRRESMALSDQEKEVIAYHEGGHAVLAHVLEHADPVHKVTILPTGMALGVTQQLPLEERHIYRQEYLEDSLVVRLGGRLAEELVFDMLSTGANNDLVGGTELARRMVREWGMSERIGPMAWGSQGAVFLGEDLMHSRDYSDDTARVIDTEVGALLRAQEERGRCLLRAHRAGLDAVAAALLEHETIDGAEVGRLIDQAAETNPGAVWWPVLNGGTPSRSAIPTIGS